MNNLDNEIILCINQLKVWKKGTNIDNICKQIIKINDLSEISKDYVLARLPTLSNEQKIKINEELIELQTANLMKYSTPLSSPVPIADTPVCNNIDDSIQNIPPAPYSRCSCVQQQ